MGPWFRLRPIETLFRNGHGYQEVWSLSSGAITHGVISDGSRHDTAKFCCGQVLQSLTSPRARLLVRHAGARVAPRVFERPPPSSRRNRCEGCGESANEVPRQVHVVAIMDRKAGPVASEFFNRAPLPCLRNRVQPDKHGQLHPQTVLRTFSKNFLQVLKASSTCFRALEYSGS